jgi:photosystem II stability/assembly factor-like uncharacterized protein
MSETSRVFVGVACAEAGTHGGLYRRDTDDGGQWQLVGDGLPPDTQVQAITVHPTDTNVIYAGTHNGPYRSSDRGEHWERLPFPEGPQVWAVLVHPTDPRIVYAGTSPVGVFRSGDGGDSWRKLPVPALPEHVKMAFPCRVMRLAADPAHPDHLYATLEVGGVIRSLDGGETWEDCSEGLIGLAERPHLKSMIQSDTDIEGMMDGHALCTSPASPDTVYLAVRMGMFRSADRGRSWEDMEVGRFSPLTYSRDVRVSPQDPRVLYACLSPAARSQDGSLYRSADLGATWTRFDHGIKAEATMMALALHPGDPDQVHAVSRCGQVFSTLDAGKTWQEHRLPEGVRDVYAVACA